MKKYFLFNCFILITLFSCQKEDDNDKKLVVSYFPNEIGHEWIYYRYDSLHSRADTLVVRITEQLHLDNGKLVSKWEYNSRYMDTVKYVYSNDDSVFIYELLESTIPVQQFLIPFEVDKTWTDPMLEYISNTVESIENLNSDYDSFSEVYKIKRSGGAFNDYITEYYWIKPYVGIIQLYNVRNTLGPVSKENWYLISTNSHHMD